VYIDQDNAARNKSCICPQHSATHHLSNQPNSTIKPANAPFS